MYMVCVYYLAQIITQPFLDTTRGPIFPAPGAPLSGIKYQSKLHVHIAHTRPSQTPRLLANDERAIVTTALRKARAHQMDTGQKRIIET